MLQYQIPQDVMIEDRIIGSMTLKQLGYLFFAFGICYLIYKKFVGNPFIWVPLCIIVGWTGAAFAFLKYHGMTLLKTIYYFIRYITFPNKRLWFQLSDFIDQNHILIELQRESLGNIKKVNVGFKKDIYSNLDFISKTLDTRGKFGVFKTAKDTAEGKGHKDSEDSFLLATVLGENHDFRQHEQRVNNMMKKSQKRFKEIEKERKEEQLKKESIELDFSTSKKQDNWEAGEISFK